MLKGLYIYLHCYILWPKFKGESNDLDRRLTITFYVLEPYRNIYIYIFIFTRTVHFSAIHTIHIYIIFIYDIHDYLLSLYYNNM